MKLFTATRFCKACFEPLRNQDLFSFLDKTVCICPKCYHEMDPKLLRFKVGGIKATSLYRYNQKIRTLIYNFKGCFDYELKDVFLAYHKRYFSFIYKGWIIVPAPSFKEKNETRGFNHVVEIYSSLSLKMIQAIEKMDNVKQTEHGKKLRRRIGEHLKWVGGDSVRGKKVLFVDDILTSGSTARACCNLIKRAGAKKVEILVIACTNGMERIEKNNDFEWLLIDYH